MMRFVAVALIFLACLQAQVFGEVDRGVGATSLVDVVKVADFDGDGVPDVLYWSVSAFGFGIKSGRGSGNFGATRNLGIARYASLLASGDFDADGDLDLAVPEASGLMIWLNDGRAHFTSMGVANSWIVTQVDSGDFDGDGDDDLLVSDGTEVKVAMSHGDGSFALTTNKVLTATKQVLAVDINGDGKSDAVLGGTIYLGDGKGGLALMSGQTSSGLHTNVAVADFDGDGDLDLARTDGVSTELLTQSLSGFSLSTGSGLQSVASDLLVAIDVDRDGDMDLWCSVGGTAPATHVLRNDGQGVFTVTQTQARGFVGGYAFDANGNGLHDSFSDLGWICQALWGPPLHGGCT